MLQIGVLMVTVRKRAFGMKGGQCVIMMSLGVYSETDWRRLLYRATPKGRHYQLELSRDLSTGQTHRKWSRAHTHTHTHTRRSVHLLAWIHTQTHTLSHRHASIT